MTKKVLGVLAALSMVGLVACSSSSDNNNTGGKSDTGTAGDAGGDTPVVVDGGKDSTPTDSAEAGPPPGDQTTGKTCTTDDDCDTNFDGIGFCSKNLYSVGPLNPTPICLGFDSSGGDACEASDDTTIRFCDFSADGSSALGVCTKSGTNPASCDAMCQMDKTGKVTMPCTGSNACNPQFFASNDAGEIVLIGTCFGGCTADSDCPSGSKCDGSQNICTKTCSAPAGCPTLSGASEFKCDTTAGYCRFQYTKKVGDVCTSSSECPCLMRTGDADGVCTEICKSGGETLPSGYVCDALLPVNDKDGNPLWSFTTLPAGLSGYAMKTCTTEGDPCTFGSGADTLKTEWTCQKSAGVGLTCQPKPTTP